jgi:energy-coupling factor transporter ATP-binding protein EcfA2
MDITLYEKVDKVKLMEVIQCDNIPFEKSDDPTWQEGFKKTIKTYNKKHNASRGTEVRYKQSDKYGRFNASCGLQSFQKDIRKYISGEFYIDLDFVNCHPVILNQLLKSNNSKLTSTKIVKQPGFSLLEEYVKDRPAYLEKHNISKTDVIKLLYSETCSKTFFKDIHAQIYQELIPELTKQNKTLLARIKAKRKKDKKDYNHLGSFLSSYLQNIENDMLQSLYGSLNKKGFRVGSLMFDGLMVEKVDEHTEEELQAILPEFVNTIKEETGYDIQIDFKSTKTEWTPNVPIAEPTKETDKEIPTKFSIETWNKLSNVLEEGEDGSKQVNQDKLLDFVSYTNNFVCLFERPHSYGWRDRTNEDFDMRNWGAIENRTGAQMKYWLASDSKLQYKKAVFIVDESDTKELEGNYNKYLRPLHKPYEGKIEDLVPTFFDFLKRIICDEDTGKFTYITHLIAKIIQKGRSEQLLVLMGEKGTGKSTYTEIMAQLVGREYSQIVNDINQIGSNFNAIFEKCIFTSIEEIVSNAGEYHSIQSKLKSLVTEKYNKIEKKGIDSYMAISNNNFNLQTNEFNPVKITSDNRRNGVMKTSIAEQNNNLYFKKLREEVALNIEFLRHYFYTFPFKDDLNSIRPTTNEELDVLELNRNPVDIFIEEGMRLRGFETNDTRKFSVVYNRYKDYCKDNNFKALSSKYFGSKLKHYGYTTVQKGKTKTTYIIGECNVDIESCSEAGSEL